MDKYKYLIVGGGAAGVSAAETIRENDKEGRVGIISDEPYLLYSRVLLSKPNFFLGKIPFESVWMKKEEWYKMNNVEFLGGKIAKRFDATAKTLTLTDGTTFAYEKLLLATGVNAREWNVPSAKTADGKTKKGIHYLRTLEDGKGIMEQIKTAKKAITVGGGFISFEMADLLKLAGLETTMLLRESYFWEPILDSASAKMLEDALAKAGVKVIKNAEVVEVLGAESVEGVVLKDGTKISCDMVMCGIGVTYPLDWIKASGVAVQKGILANEYLETNLPDVWTAGDVAEYKDILLEERTIMGNWVNAKEQGRTAALNMMDKKTPFKFVSFYTTSGFGVNIAFVGDASSGPDRVIIPRGSPEINSYARIIAVGKELVGATMINRTVEMNAISKLIENNVDISAKRAELADPNFDLKKLLN
ncbi:MAG: FAD-dependent oxidoreductase [bacterium]